MYSQVTMKVDHRGEQREVWFVLETSHPNLGALFDLMNEQGFIYGIRMATKPFGENCRKVVDQYETIINRASIVSISELQTDLMDMDGVKLFSVEEGSTAPNQVGA